MSRSDFLKFIKVLDLLLGSLVQNSVGKRKEAAARTNFVGVGSRGKFSARVHLFGDSLPELIHINARQIELADLFLERHAAH